MIFVYEPKIGLDSENTRRNFVSLFLLTLDFLPRVLRLRSHDLRLPLEL